MDLNLFGKKKWKSEGFKKEIIKEFKNKYPTYADVDYSKSTEEVLTEIAKKHNDKFFPILSSKYREMVVEEKAYWSIREKFRDAVELDYEKKDSTAFDRLPQNEQEEKVTEAMKNANSAEIEMLMKAVEIEATKIANRTISDIEDLEKKGKLINGYNASLVLLNITENISQKDFLSADMIEEWEKEFDIYGKKPDDTVEIYLFQNGALGASNYMKWGCIGAPDGMFCISKKMYAKIIASNAFSDVNGRRVCQNPQKLQEDLGNVPVGIHPIAIKVTVKVKDLATTMGGLSTAYFGEFTPKLRAQGPGNIFEALCKKQISLTETNYEVISYSPYITTVELLSIAEKVNNFFGMIEKDNIKAKYYGLEKNPKIKGISQLTKDSELLKLFKDEITKEEGIFVNTLLSRTAEEVKKEIDAKIKDDGLTARSR